jgi:hypothetical protein
MTRMIQWVVPWIATQCDPVAASKHVVLWRVETSDTTREAIVEYWRETMERISDTIASTPDDKPIR